MCHSPPSRSNAGPAHRCIPEMMAFLQRLDGTVAGLVNEIRANHTQPSRWDRLTRELEGARIVEARIVEE